MTPMAERLRIFPIVVLCAVLVVGLIIYWVSRAPRETRKDPASTIADPAPRPQPPPPPPPQGTVQAPPPTNDPGQKILDGADGAFQAGMYPTALKFYKDFELRYAGTEVYDRNLTRLWERLHTSNASSPKEKQEPEFAAYLAARRKLADEWKRLQPLTAAPPTPESKAEIEKFLPSLPPQDGRRKIIDAWRDGK